jgi:murein DD-endopeptidase MepM/ murein hydrolase activator NlpD
VTASTGELEDAVVVEFPLRGERWVAVNTPAERIPSHGTDMLGQRFAFDFLKVDSRKGIHPQPAGDLRAMFIGTRTRDAYAWGAEIRAPFDCEIVRASDGMAERGWIHPLRELALVMKNAVTFSPAKVGHVIGNHVIARHGHIYAAFAHMTPGSVAVTAGQAVRTGDLLGRVGHTGNSTSPHLHFQLMDSADPMTARGIPCAFRSYEVLRSGRWTPVERGVPGRRDRIRSVPATA